MIIIDTNILLRYLLNDVKELNKKATEIIEGNDIFIPYEVIVEATYVLFKLYDTPRDVISNIIQEVIQLENVNFTNKDTVKLAFETYKDSKLAMVDCMLYAYSKNENFDIKTFDTDLEKMIKKN